MAELGVRGRTAVVIGGTSGIGRAVSHGLAAAGANVIATSRRAEMVYEVATELEELGVSTLRVASDVRDRESLKALLAATIEAFGKVDILVNCAGQTRRQPTLTVSEDTWNEIMDINLTGTLRTAQIFGAHMLANGYGRIVNMASLGSFVAFHEVAAYCASKAAVASLTRSLAVEWGPRGVTVNAVAPGLFPTELNSKLLDGTPRGRELLLRTPAGRFGNVDEIIGPTLFLCSEAASFVNGEVLTVDGGFMASGVNQ